MKAVICERYGPPENLRIEDVERPVARSDEVLVRVHAAAVTISDCVIRSGKVKPLMWLPFRMFVGFLGPRHHILGLELSGDVEQVGSEITRFKPGDEVFAFTGRRFGAYGEYASLRDKTGYMPSQSVIAAKPSNISHAEAATVPSRGALALHFLQKAGIEPGERVLIYGASGGVGVFALQIAKHFGAHVTAVCSTSNLAFVTSLGADDALDYTAEDGVIVGPFDIFFDAVGTAKDSPLKRRCRDALVAGGRELSVDRGAKIPATSLDALRDLIEMGAVRPVLDRIYPLTEVVDAHHYVEGRHKRGGVAIAIAS